MVDKAERKRAEAILAESPKWARLSAEDKAVASERLVICQEAERAGPFRSVKGTLESHADAERGGFSFNNLKTCYYQRYRKKGAFGLIPYEWQLKARFARPEGRHRARIKILRAQAAEMLREADELEAGEPLHEKPRAAGLPMGGVRAKKSTREKLEAERARIARLKEAADKRSAGYGAKIAEIDAKLPSS